MGNNRRFPPPAFAIPLPITTSSAGEFPFSMSRKRQGCCYELAMRVMTDQPGAERFTLVHGSVVTASYGPSIRIDHAWIELPDGRIFEPGTKTYGPLPHAVANHRYSRLEACRIAVATGHYGPWTDSERQQGERGERRRKKKAPE
jgi:hypothetical protein